VTDVGEEGRLGAIDIRERFRTPFFFSVGVSIRDRGTELVGDEIQECLVGGIERSARIQADEQPPKGSCHARRHDCALIYMLAGGSCQQVLGSGCAGLQLALQVGQRIHDVVRVVRQRVHRNGAGITCRSGERRLRGEILEQRHAARRDDPFGRLSDDAVDAADVAGLHPHRVVRHIEVGFFDEAVTLEKEQQVLGPEGFTGSHDTGEQVVEHLVPDLAPGLASRKTQGARMLRAEHRTIGVVVENGEFGTPENDDLRLRRQQHAHDAAQALRPGLHCAERRGRPVVGTNEPTHFAAASEDRLRDLAWWFVKHPVSRCTSDSMRRPSVKTPIEAYPRMVVGWRGSSARRLHATARDKCLTAWLDAPLSVARTRYRRTRRPRSAPR
jgi:hypothetical protein